jgi:hypothetical protein
MPYTIAMHHHRFAAWAAARAAQRGLANSRTIIAALNGCGVVAMADTRDSQPASADEFDRLHHDWCRALLENLKSAGIKATYGQAAKIIAIYLKSRVVLSGRHDTPFASVIHPPIDSFLLKSLARHVHAQDRRLASQLRKIRWMLLNETDYDALIASLRKARFDQPAFWCIERFWNPWDDESAEQASP